MAKLIIFELKFLSFSMLKFVKIEWFAIVGERRYFIPESKGLFIFLLLMKRLLKIYRSNIYGVMGTLVFHILLLAFFLLAEMGMRRDMKEAEVVVEIPLDFGEEFQAPFPEEERMTEGNMPSSVTNRPSSRSAVASDRFFDDDYQREVAGARELSRDVSRQLSREIPDPGEIAMPEDITEGREPEEISNIVYSGESNVEYLLENRYHRRLPIPVYLARGGGIVVVDIAVNREGRVTSAQPRVTREKADDPVYGYAREAALRSLFNTDPSAPASQKGTIRYTFVAQ